MAVLLFAENGNGKFKKAVFEAAGYASELAGKFGVELHAVSIGPVSNDELAKLGAYGVSKVHNITDGGLSTFSDQGYTRAIAEVAKAIAAKSVVFAQQPALDPPWFPAQPPIRHSTAAAWSLHAGAIPEKEWRPCAPTVLRP